jgi:hypothetical protein
MLWQCEDWFDETTRALYVPSSLCDPHVEGGGRQQRDRTKNALHQVHMLDSSTIGNPLCGNYKVARNLSKGETNNEGIKYDAPR